MPPVAVEAFQNALGELAARSGEATDKLLARISVLSPIEARAFITDAYPALLAPYLAASSDLTVQWYAEQPTMERRPGSAVFTPSAAPMRSGEQLAISGRWALSTSAPATALRGNATRQVMNQSRDTVIVNAQRENVRWIRQAKSNACGFCKMLATRAAKDLAQYSYGSQGVRRKLDRYGNPTGDYTLMVIGKRGRKRRRNGRNLGSEYHDHCRCTAVPIRDGRYEPPDYVQAWTDQYDAIVAKEGTGDLLKISTLMDEGRVRLDRIPTPLQTGADLLTAAAASDAAAVPVNLDTPPPPKPPRDFDTVQKEFDDAIAAGDDAAIDRLAGELEAIEVADRKAAARAAKAKARRDAANEAKWEQVIQMIDAGADPLEAEAEVFGKLVGRLRRREEIAELRRQGYNGKSFEELINDKFVRIATEQQRAAEDATNGYMVKPKYQGRVDSFRLWTGTEKQAREWMSEEMAAWFDANGRITKRALRDDPLGFGGNDPMTPDFLQ